MTQKNPEYLRNINKVLYGFNQSPREWYAKVKEAFLEKYGMKS